MNAIGTLLNDGPRMNRRKSSSDSITLSPDGVVRVKGESMVVVTFIIGTFWK
jgi:hypothetical protein